MKINIGHVSSWFPAKLTRIAGVGLLVVAAIAGITGCTGYYSPAYGGGYYSGGYAYPYGYGYGGYGSPYYGSPYYSPYYGGSAVVISGARYHGYHSNYYRNGYYPRAQQGYHGTATTRSGATVAPHVRGSTTRTANPRTQATVPQ